MGDQFKVNQKFTEDRINRESWTNRDSMHEWLDDRKQIKVKPP